MKLGDISTHHIDALAAAIRALGKDPTPLLLQYQIDDELMANPDARISIPRLMHMGHSAIQLTGHPELGLEMGRCANIQNLGLPGLTAMAAPDLRTAMEAITRYEPLSSVNIRGQSSYLEQDEALLRFYSIAPYNDYNRFVVDSVLSMWSQLLVWLSGKRDLVKRVDIEFEAPHYQARYRDYFNCEPLFGQPYNQLAISPQLLDSPLRFSNAANFSYLSELCEQKLAQMRRGRSLQARVAEILASALHGNTPCIGEVAAKLAMPSWTLRRKLQDEGVTFQQILGETKRDLALIYVEDTALSLGEIAYLLGFSSPEAFQRAFKRWTDRTPGDYRRQPTG
ncbi:AraC family transcriptional regulator [Aestuariirhabdus litorea]|uniref:AraC family transcriptional regulator n=1 Tax=Aestuariirhabdus litorea TaxID=2528527 RepID=A0A3P3VQ97_9GAMM|nr:AraC family transcriptional regulator [Aestuariirhabdus litorea]RRJ84624.1 AraC family transcriptional regulator [Aestuariirhabdus litorea]RWW97849.1 helix-turn-helix domain-containing protein [Endozoicomonadaceae bacterium GTF-13]